MSRMAVLPELWPTKTRSEDSLGAVALVSALFVRLAGASRHSIAPYVVDDVAVVRFVPFVGHSLVSCPTAAAAVGLMFFPSLWRLMRDCFPLLLRDHAWRGER